MFSSNEFVFGGEDTSIRDETVLEINRSIPENCVGCPNIELLTEEVVEARESASFIGDIGNAENAAEAIVDLFSRIGIPEDMPDDIRESTAERFKQKNSQDIQSQILQMSGHTLEHIDESESESIEAIKDLTSGCDGLLKIRIPARNLRRDDPVVLGVCRTQKEGNPINQVNPKAGIAVTVRRDS